MTTTTDRDDAAQPPTVGGVGVAVRLNGSQPATATTEQVESWLARARGVAVPGTTTATVLALTRGDD